MFTRWFGKLAKSSGKQTRRTTARQGRFGRKLFLEVLEDRTVLSPLQLTVNSLGDAGTGTGTTGDLRYCITLANQNNNAGSTPDQITFASGLQGTILLQQGQLPITDPNLVIAGPGAGRLTVSGDDASRVLDIASGASVSIVGLTIAHGRATQGAGIENAGLLSLFRVVVADNQAVNDAGNARGGGIFNASGATLLVSHSTLMDDLASAHPGTAEGSLGGGGRGGGLYNEGDATLDHSTLTGNQAVGGGGSFTTGGRGGAVFNGSADPPTGPAATLTITYSTLSDNLALGEVGDAGQFGGRALGGAVFNRYATVTIDHSTFDDNQALAGPSGAGVSGNFGGGGAIANTTAGTFTSTVTIDHSTFSGNRAVGGTAAPGLPGGNADGGAIYNESDLTIDRSTLSRNQVTGGLGGNTGVGAFDGSGLGGAIFNTIIARVTISHSTLDRNQALGGPANDIGNGGNASGGAIFDASAAVVTLDHVTLTRNRALGAAGGTGGHGGNAFGGGIRNISNMMLTITASTFSDNQAAAGDGGDGGNGGTALGGGISTAGGSVCIDQSSVTGNEALGGTAGTGGQDGQGIGGGVYIGAGMVAIQDTQVADNHASTSDDDVFGIFSDQC